MLTLSDRLYRLLLRLYPPSFRRRFGTEMALVFQDRCRQEQRLGGRRGLLALWMRTLGDIAMTVPRENLLALFQSVRARELRPGILSVAALTVVVAVVANYSVWSVLGAFLQHTYVIAARFPADLLFYLLAATSVLIVIGGVLFAAATFQRLRPLPRRRGR